MNIERTPPTMTHEEMINKILADDGFRAECERLKREEFKLFDEILNARPRA
jgi:hypothetical protein